MIINKNSPIGEIIAKARKLNNTINDLRQSKNSRNWAITELTALESETGLDLRR